ncbi:hypothetical protein HIM_00232 [Hirsutella minnesotensis 3608]|nr:hypothetical protein HIM_00232 [Hirsutella minnesotensis 3608]
MIPNSENATARFLYAILKQKNLKDIDWDQVARDPALLQPISNGHAARMRFSRFRSTVDGHEPPKRSRAGDKARVTKVKKESLSKKAVVKSERGTNLTSCAQFSPASVTSPYLCDVQEDLSTRFLTPCSDDMSHVMTAPSAAAIEGYYHPASVHASSSDGSPDLQHQPDLSPELPIFDTGYDAEFYDVGSVADQDHNLSNANTAPSMQDYTPAWGDRFTDYPLF